MSDPDPIVSNLPILCLDFDGVIHRYSKGWQDGQIYDPPTDGFFKWATSTNHHFKLMVHSSRSKHWDGIQAMAHWLAEHAAHEGWSVTEWPRFERPVMRLLHARDANVIVLTFVQEKPPAFVTIDDRALTFRGDWNEMSVPGLLSFKPWNIDP